ncbi:unnamed protein product [Calicophoron daubneyi]|uniref:Doublecortin domain-containing protein n=1 Tax=Calicophoron daubneyi TaxID=300641 RepID=A0AAV2T5L4_CALDB
MLPAVKTAYFYQDGEVNAHGVRLAIHPNRYRSLEALLGDLTEKMPKLLCGARAIYTPNGKEKIKSLADLENNGHYICSERLLRPRVMSAERRNRTALNGGMMDCEKSPIKKTKAYSTYKINRSSTPRRKENMPQELPHLSSSLKIKGSSTHSLNETKLPPAKTRSKSGEQRYQTPSSTLNHTQESKTLHVRLSGTEQKRKTVLLRRTRVQGMRQVLQELTHLFGFPVSKVYTLDGKLINSVDELINGPEEIVAAGPEGLRSNGVERSVLRNALCHSEKMKVQSRSRSKTSRIKPTMDATDLSKPLTRQNRDNGRNVSRPLKVYISSASIHPETGEQCISACTSNVWLTICYQDHTVQAILLRPVYTKSITDKVHSESQEKISPQNSTCISDRFSEPFIPGQTDRFDVLLSSSSEIYKIRLSHDGTGTYPEWLPGEVKMRIASNKWSTSSLLPGGTKVPSMETRMSRSLVQQHSMLKASLDRLIRQSTEITFPCMQWLSRTKADGSLAREIAAPGTQYWKLKSSLGDRVKDWPVDPLMVAMQGDRIPTVLYQLIVTTGKLWNAGTKAKVSFVLSGDGGDTGLRALWNPEIQPLTAFSRGKTSVFYVEAVFLGRLRRLSLWLDSTNPELDSWYLERILVRELPRVQGNSTYAQNVGPADTQPGSLCSITYFPCRRWLEAKPTSGTPGVHLVARAGSGGLTKELIDQKTLASEESIWWEANKWKFRRGTKLMFYTYVTGAPLRVVECHRIEARKENNSNNEETKSSAVFTVSNVYSGYYRTRRLKLRHQINLESAGIKKPADLLEEDVERYNEKMEASAIRSFRSCLDSMNLMCLHDIHGLCVTDDQSSLTRPVGESSSFRICCQPDFWICLESVRDYEDRTKTHVYVGPDGCIVSGASGPASVPGKLLMPYVKGTFRDQTILWLCTNSQQTLAPSLRTIDTVDLYDENSVPKNEWNLELNGTEPKDENAQWRVKKFARDIRLFESKAWPGHFLRSIGDTVDVMGSGNTDCQFLIKRSKSKGYFQLIPLVNQEKFIGMNEDGTVALFDKDDGGNTRFYPEVVQYGVRCQKVSITESASLSSIGMSEDVSHTPENEKLVGFPSEESSNVQELHCTQNAYDATRNNVGTSWANEELKEKQDAIDNSNC